MIYIKRLNIWINENFIYTIESNPNAEIQEHKEYIWTINLIKGRSINVSDEELKDILQQMAYEEQGRNYDKAMLASAIGGLQSELSRTRQAMAWLE